MERRTKLLTTFAVLLLGGLAAACWADTQEPFIAESPERVRPLLIGADIPDMTLVTPDHRPIVLREALAKQPTILIYYRGGW